MKIFAVLLIAVIVIIGALVLAIFFIFYQISHCCPPPPCQTLTITFAYSTEKEGWIKYAMAEYDKENHQLTSADGKKMCIQVVSSTVRGSVDMVQQILKGKDADQPTIWSPASSLELQLLNTEWLPQEHPGSPNIIASTGDDAQQSLVYSPLVFAIWKERAAVLIAQYKTIDWNTLAMAMQSGWSNIGGHPGMDWGHDVKFGHTEPDLSNSGLLTVTLLAYAFAKTQSGLTPEIINQDKFKAYLKIFEDKVYCFGASSEPLIDNAILRGPGQYDIISTYENLVLTKKNEAQKRWGQTLQIFYPPLNILSDHPFAILQGKWVKKEQEQGALNFRQFLLDKPMQELALTYGFRPTNVDVPLTGNVTIPGRPDNPFAHLHDIKMNIEPLAKPPSGEVIHALIDLWKGMYGGDKSCKL